MKSLVNSSGVRNVEILFEAVVSSPSLHQLNQHIISTCFLGCVVQIFSQCRFQYFYCSWLQKRLEHYIIGINAFPGYLTQVLSVSFQGEIFETNHSLLFTPKWAKILKPNRSIKNREGKNDESFVWNLTCVVLLGCGQTTLWSKPIFSYSVSKIKAVYLMTVTVFVVVYCFISHGKCSLDIWKPNSGYSLTFAKP